MFHCYSHPPSLKHRHYAADDDTADETIIECLLKAAPQTILMKDKKGRTPLDRGREAEVSMAAYNVLRAYFKEQKEKEKLGLGLVKKSPSGKVKKKKVKKEGLNDSTASIDFQLTTGEDLGDSSTTLDLDAKRSTKKLGGRVKNKKIKKEGLNDSTASIDFQLTTGEELGDSATSLDLDVKRSTKKEIKNKKELNRSMSMDSDINSVEFIDLNDGERGSFSSADLGASLRRSTKSITSTKKKKKKNGEPSESSIRARLNQEVDSVSFVAQETPKKKKKKKDGSQDSAWLDDSTSPTNGKSKKKTTAKDKSSSRSLTSSTRSLSTSRRPSSARKQNEEAMVDSDGLGALVFCTLETPKPSKNHVDGTLKTPGSVSSKTIKTPTSSVVARRRRLKKDFSEILTPDEIGEEGESPGEAIPTTSSSTRSLKSRSKSLNSHQSIKKRSKSSSRLQGSSRSPSKYDSPVLPDLMIPSHAKTYSAMISDFLSTPQLGGESMAFLPPVWAEEEIDLK
jgi:hypothetical protein